MMIPWRSLFYDETQTAEPGAEVRANFFLNEGPTDSRKDITWQPTNGKTFHVPEAFGILRLKN